MPPIRRCLMSTVEEMLTESPAVGLVGPRQVGKSTLARSLVADRDAVFLDLQLAETRAQLAEPTLFFRANAERLVVIDEVQRMPELFSTLRPLIDEDRRPGRFLLLGSASPALMRGAAESLAGRIFYAELPPLSLPEALGAGYTLADHLVHGGYPQPLLELSDRGRRRWSNNYLTTFITRDLAELGVGTNPQEFERLLALLAHTHGGLFNASELARSLRITAPTVQRYVDLLEQAFLVRVLRPLHGNAGKRLVKRPRVYWRDSGLRHGLLGIRSYNDLLLNPALGASWEGYALEEVCRAAGEFAKPSFYRTAKGAEIDLVLELDGGRRLGFEFKFSTGPALGRGTYSAMDDTGLERLFVVTPETGGFALAETVEVVSLGKLLDKRFSTRQS